MVEDAKKGPNRDELKLWRASQSGDLSQMANVVIKYTSGSSFTNKIPNLEGQEIFGSKKWKVDITSWLEGNSYMHDCVNFSRLKINAMLSGFASSNVDDGESTRILKDEPFVLTYQGLKVQECVCRDGIWIIKRCPPLSNTHFFAIQRDSTKYYDVIAKKNSWHT